MNEPTLYDVIILGIIQIRYTRRGYNHLAGYMTSKASVPVSLPLKKCSHGTILQVEIQCLTPRTIVRDEKCKDMNSHAEEANVDYDDIESKSDMSDNTFTKSVGSLSSNPFGSTSQPGELCSRETSFSASGSHRSFDSMEDSLGRESFSPQSNLSGTVSNMIGRQDSVGSQICASYGSSHVYDSPGSSHSASNSGISVSGKHIQNPKEDFGRMSHAVATSPLRNTNSSKIFLESEEFRAEARIWEQNARKLMLDLENLRQEFAEQSKRMANLDMELAASHTDCDGLKQEIEHLKVLLEEATAKQKANENLKLQAKDMDKIHRELEDEIRFQKESNDNLALHLKKTQESNVELVSVLQELEQTIEKQKLDMEKLLTVKLASNHAGEKYNNVRQENGETIISEEVSAEKKRKASCDSYSEGNFVDHSITDSNTLPEAEGIWNLEIQLQQLRASQNNLENTILCLEKTLEDKYQEIELQQDLNSKALLDCEAEWRYKLNVKEEEIIHLEAKLSKACSAQDPTGIEFKNNGELDLTKEVESLKEKIQELERDCNELTYENLELIFKLKESGKDHSTSKSSFNAASNENTATHFSSNSESELSKLESPFQQECEMNKKEILPDTVASDHLQMRCSDLESKCTHLELQLQTFEDEARILNTELQKCRAKEQEQETKITALRQQIECPQREKTGSQYPDADICMACENTEQKMSSAENGLFPALCEQLQILLVNVKKQQYSHSAIKTGCSYDSNNLHDTKCSDPILKIEQTQAMLDKLIHLNELLGSKLACSQDKFQSREENISARATHVYEVQHKLESDELGEYILSASSQELQSLNKEQGSRVEDLSNDLLAKTSEVQELKADCLLKDEEIKALRCRQRDLETQLSDVQQIDRQMEEKMDIMQRDSSITSKSLDNLRDDMMVLSSNMNSHISAYKTLEREKLELESGKHESELHLSELEEENVCLSERISGLEAQLRYLTDARESSRLEVQHSESLVMNLLDQIRKLENEMEAQKVDMKEKLHNVQKRWLESQEECEYLNKANLKLQATAESLIEEWGSLQKLNGELRRQRSELHNHCTTMEVELRESRNVLSESSNKIEALEAKFSSMLEEIASKERVLVLELDALHLQNKEQKEKLVLGERLLNQLYLEKADEAENLQQVLAHLTNQITATPDERERKASEAILELHTLHVDKSKLEAALQEVQGKVELSEKKLNNVQMESETKVLELKRELATSKQNHEVLVANHEKLLGLLENARSNEDKLKGIIKKLESELRSTEYERLQLAEETSSLKIQLLRVPVLQDEVLALKSSQNEMKFENERLETSLQLVAGDFEELKAERILLLQKLSGMHNAVPELEDCRRNKIALEEKILRLEGDLTAREALNAQDAEMKNELGRLRRAISQFQWKIKCLEEEKGESIKEFQNLKEELKKEKAVKQHQIEPATEHLPIYPQYNYTSSIHEEFELSEVDGKHDNYTSSQKRAIDLASRIQYLENELSEALEANAMYKSQLRSLLSQRQNSESDAPKKLEAQEKETNKEEDKQKESFLEAELREIQERYLHMSLKYAEVEAQREQLVMKLKTIKCQ
ncbi:unnamed protein product [Ilex paraguariensis]|uniref:Uncharacterized protein n=1 Tax=Ilex paraguariensis TaxID=185542 RepID=A0ABC8T239_9AQUA